MDFVCTDEYETIIVLVDAFYACFIIDLCLNWFIKFTIFAHNIKVEHFMSLLLLKPAHHCEFGAFAIQHLENTV